MRSAIALLIVSAAAVVVGHAVGRGDAAGVRRSTAAALIVGAGFMLCAGALFVCAPELLARLYTNDEAVIALLQAEQITRELVRGHVLVRQLVSDLLTMQDPPAAELRDLARRLTAKSV